MMNLNFDDLVFDNLAESLEGIFPEILDVFFLETELSLNDFQTQIYDQRWEEIKAASHKMKSSSKTFGAMGLAKMFDDIEHGELKDITHVSGLHEALMKEYELVKQYILDKSI